MASERTLTRAQLSDTIHSKIGLSRTESAQFVQSILDHIANALVAGENVKISGFGSFLVREKAARFGRNPKTGEKVPIPPRKVLTFRASQIIRTDIAKGK